MNKLFKIFTSLLLISGLVFYVGCEEDATTAADPHDRLHRLQSGRNRLL